MGRILNQRKLKTVEFGLTLKAVVANFNEPLDCVKK